MLADKTSRNGLNTNLAAEFYVASMLWRLGYRVTVTFGNAKAIDLIAGDDRGRSVTIDVKGLKNKTNWPITSRPRVAKNHLFVFVTFRDRIGDSRSSPTCFIVPSFRVKKHISEWSGSKGKRHGVTFKCLSGAGCYEDAWRLIGTSLR